jgi:ATP-dependent Clp protease ATP-binding subunit ClpC
MISRYTDRARRILELADSATRRLGHPAVHTGHVLLGCIEEEHGLAGKVLARFGLVNTAIVIDRLLLRRLSTHEASDEMQAFDKAAELWASRLNHNYQGTEHLLLAMVTLPACQAARALTMQGQSLREIGEEVLLILGHNDIPWLD